MESLVPAFVLALLLQPGDRAASAVAALATRTGRPLAAVLGATIGIAAGCALAASGGALLRPGLTPEAQRLMLALALLMGGGGALFPQKLDPLEEWRLGAFGTGLLGVGTLALGDATQFIVLALALGGTTPALAAIGAVVASAAVLGAAAAMGAFGWRRLPRRALRLGTAVLLLGAGAVIGAGALRVI